MSIDAKARQLLDRRMTAVITLSDTLAAIAKTRDELDVRERQAWLAATRAGWTEKDLTDLGLTAPKRPRPQRKRRDPDEPPAEHVVLSGQDDGREYAA